jgi:hypothetical protein
MKPGNSLNYLNHCPKNSKNSGNKGQKHTAVSTKGDLHFHIRADEKSFAYDMASVISGYERNCRLCC